MLLLLLPLGLRYRSSAGVELISLLKPCYICFDMEKVLVGLPSGVGHAVPGGTTL